MDINQTIKQFLQTEFTIEQDLTDLQDTDPLLGTGIVDSLGIVKLVTYIESKFPVKISDEEIISENFDSINAISSLIRNKMQ
jgi:acyl carrier protein